MPRRARRSRRRPLRSARLASLNASTPRSSPGRSARAGANDLRAAPRSRRRSACRGLRPALPPATSSRTRSRKVRSPSAASASSSSSSSRRATESRSSCENCSRPASSSECASQNFPWTAASSESSAARSAPGCSSASGKCRQTRRRVSKRSRSDFTGRLAAKQNGQPKSPYSTSVTLGRVGAHDVIAVFDRRQRARRAARAPVLRYLRLGLLGCGRQRSRRLSRRAPWRQKAGFSARISGNRA